MENSPKEKILMQTNISLPDILPEINAIVNNLLLAQILELSNMFLDTTERVLHRVNNFSKNIVQLCIETKRSFVL